MGAPPKIRIDGKLVDTEYEPLMPEATKKLIYSVIGADQVAKFEKNLEIDFSFGVTNLGRFGSTTSSCSAGRWRRSCA